MTIHRFDALVRPIGVSASRRLILQRLSRASLLAATVTIAPQLVRAQDATPTSDLEANKALARQYHDEIFEQGNLDAADEILTPDFTWYAPPQTVSVVGPEAVKQTAKDVRAYFGDDLTLSARRCDRRRGSGGDPLDADRHRADRPWRRARGLHRHRHLPHRGRQAG